MKYRYFFFMSLFFFPLQSMNYLKKWYSYLQNSGKIIKKKYQTFVDKALEDSIRKNQKTYTLELLIMLGANVNARMCFRSPLEVATLWNNLLAVKVLLRNGANPNADYGNYKDNSFSMAANHDNDKMIRLLLDYGADIDIYAPLRHSASRGKYQTVLTLLACGASIDDPAPLVQAIFQIPFVHACEREQHIKIAKALLYAGTDPYKKSEREKRAPIEFKNELFKKLLENHFTIAKFCCTKELKDLNQMMESRSVALIKKNGNTAKKGSFFKQQRYRELTGKFLK